MGPVHRFFFSFFCRIVRLLLSLRYQIELKGLEDVLALKKGKSGFLFLPNHPAEIDPIIVMSILGPHFFPRSIIVEHFYQLKGFKKILDYGRVVPVPSMEEKANKWKKKELSKTFSYIKERLAAGENFMIYPAGKLKRSGIEKIGGASFVHALVSEKPDIPLVLVRTTGLWGSSFSVAKTGSTPAFGKTLFFSFKVVLKNLFLFVPKRNLVIELNAHPAIPKNEGRLEFNRALEIWYNQYPGEEEPLLQVPYAFWSKKLEPIFQTRLEVEQREFQSCPKIKEEVISYLSQLSKMPKEKIIEEADLAFDLGLDSLDIAEVHGFLDKKYDAAGTPLGDLKKVNDVLRAIAEKKFVEPLLEKEQAEISQKRMRGWFEKKRQEPSVAPGNTIPEVFLNCAKKMSSSIACADERSGSLSYFKVKVSALILAEEFRSLPGDRIAVLLPSSVATYITILALLLAGKVPVMLNWTAGKNALNHALKIGQFQVALTSKKFLDKIHLEDLGEIEEIFVFLEEVKDSLTFTKKIGAFKKSFMSTSALLKNLGLSSDPDKMAVLLFTSGSESMPKAVPLTHRHLLENQRGAFPFSRFTANDSLYGVLPPFHSFGFSLTGLLPLLCGLKVFYAPDPTDSYKMAFDIEKMKLTVVCLAPSFIRSLFAAAQLSQLKTLTAVISGAEKYPPELPLFVKENLPFADWIEGYGITECSPVVTLHRRGTKNAGVGKPLPGISLCTVDPETLEVLPSGSEGEICIHGPSVFNGYLGLENVNPFLWIESERWYRSGDLGYIDNEGNLHITDRLKRTVKIGGEMVSLHSIELEIERLAKENDWPRKEGLPSFAVLPVKGEKPSLVLFAIGPITEEEVNHALRESGSGRIIKISKIVQVSEIPLTGTGKIHYRSLEVMLKEIA